MPRRKQNVDMYGKSWSPIDLPNLEKAVKLFERLNYLQDHFADSLSGSQAIMAQINETTEINEELKKMNIKLDEKQLNVLIAKLHKQQEVNQEEVKATAPRKHTYDTTTSNIYNKKTYQGIKPETSLNWQNAGSNLMNAVQYNKAMKLEMSNIKQTMNERGSILSDKGTRRLAELNLKNGKYSQDTAKYLNKSSAAFGTAASLIQVAATTFQAGVKEFTSMFGSGLKQQKQVFENTFENISVRTGLTRSDYYDKQIKLNNELSKLDLRDNIRTSDIQKMWDSYASNGFDETTMFINGIDSVLTNKIVPYLDTTTQESQLLNNRLNGDFFKQIRGINKYNQEIAGGNFVTQDILNSMIDKITPMSDEAIQNLALGSSEMSALMNKLINERGFTKDQALNQVKQVYKQQQYSDEILRSGGVYDKLSLIQNLQTIPNMYDPSYSSDVIANNISVGQQLMRTSPGYTSSMNGLYTNIIRNAYGIPDFNDANAYLKLNESNVNIYNELDKIKSDQATLNKYADQATKNYAQGKNQTNSTLQEITVENLANELAVGEEWMGHWTGIIEAAIKGLGTLITGWLGTKLLGGVIGKGIGRTSAASSGMSTLIGSGLANGFAKGAPKAIGAGKIGAFTGTAGAVAGTAGVLAGGAMAIKGGSDVYNDLSSGDGWSGKTTASAVGAIGGLAGGAAILALGASNPIGWVALAIGGAALLGRSLYESAHNYEKAGKAVEAEFNEVSLNLQKEAMNREENLIQIKNELQSGGDLEKSRQALIQSGILSEEDTQKAQKSSREELEKLTEQYISSTKKFSNTEQQLLEQIKNDKVSDANDSAKSIKEWFEQDFKKNNTAENNEVAKNLILNTAQRLESKGQSNWSDSEKAFMDRYSKNSREGKWDYDDLKWVLKGGGSLGSVSNAIMDNTTDILTNTGFANYAKDHGKNITNYSSINTDLIPYAAAILEASTKEEGEKAVENAKAAGMVYSEWSNYIGNKLSQLGIPAFKSGLNNVPYDNYPALLHEGEAVLTANTATELRGLIDEYRQTSNSFAGFEAVIQAQTVSIIEKMDQIITTISSNTNTVTTDNLTSAYNTKRNVFSSMVSLKSTKAAF